MEKFVENPTFKIDGDVGAKIASELNLDFSTTDSFVLSVNLGDIEKTKVSFDMINLSISILKCLWRSSLIMKSINRELKMRRDYSVFSLRNFQAYDKLRAWSTSGVRYHTHKSHAWTMFEACDYFKRNLYCHCKNYNSIRRSKVIFPHRNVRNFVKIDKSIKLDLSILTVSSRQIKSLGKWQH